MDKYRIKNHPIISGRNDEKKINFTFDGKEFTAKSGETISSALFANGIHVLRYHKKDGRPQGIFCSNGQCSQCMVIADKIPVKSCVTQLKDGMEIIQLKKGQDPKLKEDDAPLKNLSSNPIIIKTDVLIIGAGPAGLSAALELLEKKVKTIITDDKPVVGGKLSLQTHKFFGSIDECYAGTRGFDIGKKLLNDIREKESIDLWLSSPAVGVFSDGLIGVMKEDKFILVKPKNLLVTTGAREKAIYFPGCDLPGIYGAGAFQTLVNRDLIKPTERIFIVGGGNVGLITAFHALQAGIDVLGIVEAFSECGGYKVHENKLKRLGVPIFTNHTVIEAKGCEELEKIKIAQIDEKFKPIRGTEKEYEVDTLLIAVGLNPVSELFEQAKNFGLKVYSAGDSEVIAEASAAIFSGKLIGRKILKDSGYKDIEIPKSLVKQLKIMRGKAGEIHESKGINLNQNKIYPIIRCFQEIPCNPCASSCPKKAIKIKPENIMEIPKFVGECIGCKKCILICPGMAINLIDESYDEKKEKSLVILPWEMPKGTVKVGDEVTTTGYEGEIIGKGKIIEIQLGTWQDKRSLVNLEVPYDERKLISGIKIREHSIGKKVKSNEIVDNGKIIVCRCEQVVKEDIKEAILSGERDLNIIKAKLRAGMGHCGGKTCTNLIMRIFSECGVPDSEIKKPTLRPFEMEIPLKAFLNEKGEEKTTTI